MIEFFAIVGFGTIIYLAVKHYEKIQNDKANSEEELNEIIKVLKYNNPTFRELFRSFERVQRSLDSDDDDDLIISKGFYTKIFDINTYAHSASAAENFKNKILTALKELKSTEAGKKEIAEIILKEKTYEEKRDKISKYFLLELEKNHIAYSNELKYLFPVDKSFELGKSDFIKKLKTIQEFANIDDELVYKKFTNRQTGLIYHFHDDKYLFDTKYVLQIKNTRDQTYDNLNRTIVDKIMLEP